MADPNTRQGKRTPVTLKIKFKSETLEQFIERYAVDVSQGGIFIRTKEPLAVGTQMKFEFQLRDASPLIAGEGTVVWTRENDPSRPAIAPGMGVRFDKLADGSQQVLEKILAEKAKQAPQRAHTEQTKPPMFTDTPTRVAPAPVQDALLGSRTESKNKLPRARSDSEQTPLPKPMPFHSDADEFPEEAFEEATKVRSLDELVAQTAEAEPKPEKTTVMPLDELAARRQGARADSTLADPPTADNPALATKNEPDRESAPGLPSPPDTSRKVLDTSPSPRPSKPAIDEAPAERSGRASVPPASESPAKTKLGLEPAKASTAAKDKDKEEGTEKVDRRAAPRTAVASEPSRPHAPSKPSIAPIIIGVLLLVAAGVAALWFFVLREPAAEKAAQQGQQGSNTELVQPGSADTGSAVGMTGSADTGSAVGMTGSADTGSAVGMTGSAGETNGSAVAMAGSAAAGTKTVDTVITSPTPKAVIEILTTGQTGASPLTAKLEKDKTYKGRVTAPGYVGKLLVLKGGEKTTVRLEAKPRILTVTSDPPGAEIYVDGAATGQQTPADVKLSPNRTKVRVTLRKAGFRALDQQVDVMSQLIEDDNKLSGNLSGKLEKAPVVANPGNGGATHPAGAGSAATPTSGGSGSATTPESGTSGTGTTGTGTTGTGTTGTGTTGTGTTGTGTTGTGTSGTGASGTGTTTPPASGTGSAAKSGEPEPDWSKQK